MLAGNIDGDGAEDIVLNWDEIDCLAGPARPFCGASACAADVFLSMQFPRTRKPETLLAQGVSLQPLSNGNDGVQVGGTLNACLKRGFEACEFLYYWDGYGLRELP